MVVKWFAFTSCPLVIAVWRPSGTRVDTWRVRACWCWCQRQLMVCYTPVGRARCKGLHPRDPAGTRESSRDECSLPPYPEETYGAGPLMFHCALPPGMAQGVGWGCGGGAGGGGGVVGVSGGTIPQLHQGLGLAPCIQCGVVFWFATLMYNRVFSINGSTRSDGGHRLDQSADINLRSRYNNPDIRTLLLSGRWPIWTSRDLPLISIFAPDSCTSCNEIKQIRYCWYMVMGLTREINSQQVKQVISPYSCRFYI